VTPELETWVTISAVATSLRLVDAFQKDYQINNTIMILPTSVISLI